MVVALRESPEPLSRSQLFQATALGRVPAEKDPSGLLVERHEVTPATEAEVVTLERLRFESAKRHANFSFVTQNVDYRVPAAQTAAEIAKEQEKENLKFNAVVLQEVRVTSLDPGESHKHAQIIADELGMEIAAFVPNFLLQKKYELSKAARDEEVIGAMAILTSDPVVPGSEMVLPLLGRDVGADEVGGTHRRIDFYRKSYGIPILLLAQVQHPEREKPITVGTFHLPTSFESRRHRFTAARNLGAYIEQYGVDMAGGDTNAAPGSRVMDIIYDASVRSDDLTDGPTFSGGYGPLRVDPLGISRLHFERRLDAVVRGKNSSIQNTAGIILDKGAGDHHRIAVVGKV